ncbi:MAG: ATP-binding protein, partial [Acidobacteria bacterium]|nr:ATP-binding protein [Acidobacteriota bacterium]
RVRIFNEEGRIRFSTDPAEVDTLLDKRAEQCYACHAQEQPIHKLARPDRARIFLEPGGGRTLAVIRPIENQKDCSNTGCHPAERRVLGVIDAHLSLANVDTQIASQRTHLVRFTVLGMLLVSLLSLAFIWLVVHHPIRELLAGIRRVGRGDLNYRLPVRSNDELGELAGAFNKMTARVSEAHEQLTQWARTLEERVQRKTEELSRAHKVLVNTEKMASLGKLAATVAHEVNNPLFGMLTYARLTLKSLEPLAIDEKTKGDMRDNLRVIERESRRCGDIMKNLLTFARQAPPSRAASNVNTLVERALSLVKHQLALQNIELEAHLDPALPDAYCDSGQIQQVLLVLVVNAIEVMPNGGKIFATTAADRARNLIRISVRDSGPGIPEDVMPQIFEPFFTTKENQHRTGLGLAIAKNIVDQHEGTIQVNSEPGRGAEFVVEIPIDNAHRQPGAPREGYGR